MIIIRVYTSPTMNRLTKTFADDDHDHEGSGYGYGDGDGEDNHGGEGHEEEGSGDHGEEGSGELEAAGESLQQPQQLQQPGTTRLTHCWCRT